MSNVRKPLYPLSWVFLRSPDGRWGRPTSIIHLELKPAELAGEAALRGVARQRFALNDLASLAITSKP